MIAPTRPHTLLAGIILIVALAGLGLTIGAQSAHSASTTSCRLSESEKFPQVTKPTYNLYLKVAGTSCATAKKVARGFHACRSVKSYKCSRKVRKTWRCTGKKGVNIASQFDATFTCTSGKSVVKGKYTQFTTS